MRHRKSNQGSAFILVIGVMTTLAMVGTVFFLIAMGDAKMSVAQSEAAPMNSVVQCELSRIQDALLEDLHISGSSGPYSSGGCRGYMDYASPDPADENDVHLASTERAWAAVNAQSSGRKMVEEAGFWPRITNLITDKPVTNVDPGLGYCRANLGYLSDDEIDEGDDLPPLAFADPSKVRIPDALDSAGVTWSDDWEVDEDPADDEELNAVPLVDADGDGVNDSFLYGTGVFDRNGEQYYAAVRLIDLSGLVNVNTASYDANRSVHGSDDEARWMTAGMVDTSYFPHDWPTAVSDTFDDATPGMLWNDANVHEFPMSNVQTMRENGVAGGYELFYYNCVRRPENPYTSSGSYALFDWSDEFACRWLDTASWGLGTNAEANPNVSPLMQNSRLWRAISPVADADTQWARWARNLTTASAGRILARPTETVSGWEMPKVKVNLNRPLGTQAERDSAFDWFRRGFYHLLADTDSAKIDDRQDIARQMAVNLIDYRDGDDHPTVVHVSGKYYMGVERQPFIVQAWGKCDNATTPADSTDDIYHMALVLYNPYNEPISLDGWRLLTTKAGEDCDPDDSDDSNIQNAAHLDGSASSIPSKGFLIIRGDQGRASKLRHRTDPQCVNVELSIFDPSNPTASYDMHPRDTVTIYRPGWDAATGAVSYLDAHYVPVGRVTMAVDAGTDDYLKHWVREINEVPGDGFTHAVAKYVKTDGAGTVDFDPITAGVEELGQLGLMGSSSEFDKIPQTPVFVRGCDVGGDGTPDDDAPLLNVAELNRILMVGPSLDGGPLDMRLHELMFKAKRGGSTPTKSDNYNAGRLNAMEDSDLDWAGNPDLPMFCLAADLFTVQSPLEDFEDPANPVSKLDNDGDGIRNPDGSNVAQWNRETRVIGRININTATMDTLCTLPWLIDQETVRLRAAAMLISYRDRCAPIDLDGDASNGADHVDFPAGRRARLGASLLREDLGFAASGEPVVAVQSVFGSRNEYFTGGADYTMDHRYPAYTYDDTDDGFDRSLLTEDLTKQNLRYAYLSNLLAVNSDTYCAYIWIQKGSNPKAENLVRRRYVAILDRSNCYEDTDRPQVRALAEVK